MNKTNKVNFAYDPGERFTLTPGGVGEDHRRLFTTLQEQLLEEAFADTEALDLHTPLKRAANDAAALAWTTAFPLLVFPTLFAEKAKQTRIQTDRQRRVYARTEEFLEAVA